MKRVSMRWFASFALLTLLATGKLHAISCSQATISLTPSGTITVAGGGGSGFVIVTTMIDDGGITCSFTMSSSFFIHLSPPQDTGNHFQFQVNYNVDPNPDLSKRNGSITARLDVSGNSATDPVVQNPSTGDFSLAAAPSSQDVMPGSSVPYNVSISRSAPFTGCVLLSASGQPSGVNVAFNPNPACGSTSTMTVSPLAFVSPIDFPIIISGTNGPVTRTTSVGVNVLPQCANCATMQRDGNFVIYGPSGNPLWSSGTSGTNAAIVRVQDDGNLVVYAEVWQAGTFAAPSPGPFPTQTCAIGTLLHAPQNLTSGQCIVSPKGQYLLYMASDGNFFIYDIAHQTGTWGTGVTGQFGAFAALQTDGNFVEYSASGRPLWNSGTQNTGADLLNMEDDGRIVLYRPVWNSGTSQGWDTVQRPHPSCDVGPGTGWTGAIGIGQCFVSPNGRYELLLTANDELVLYDLSVNPAAVLWQRP